MSLLNIPTQDAIQQFHAQQENTYVPKPDDDITKPKTSADLEYIGKQIFNALDDIAKTGSLFTASILDKIGLSDNAGYYYSQLTKPSPVTLPTPDQLSITGRLLGDVARGLAPFMVPGIGLPLGVATTGSKTAMDLINEVDEGTASKAALSAAGAAVAFAGAGKVMGAGKTLLGTIGRQTAANLPVGVASRALEKSILEDQYPELADQIKVFGGKELGLDVTLSVLFGGLTHRAAVRAVQATTGKSELDAMRDVSKAEEIISSDVRVEDAVRTQQAHEVVKESMPFEGEDAYNRHVAAVDKAMQDIENGRVVEVDGIVGDEPFTPEAQAQVEELARQAEKLSPLTTPADRNAPPAPETTILVKTIDESGNITETKMHPEEAIKQYKETDKLLTDILNCVKGVIE